MPDPLPGVRPLEALTAFILRREHCGPADLGPLLNDALDAVAALGLSPTGPPTLCYIALPPEATSFEDATLEAWIPLDPALTPDSLPLTPIPEVPLAATLYLRGSHANIPAGYATLLAFIEREHYQVSGLPREHYWEHNEDGAHLTELCFPVIDMLPEGERPY